MDAPSIIPHVAQQNQQKFSYEYLFKSMTRLLMDTASSEYIFNCEFFAEYDQLELAQQIFDKIVSLYMVPTKFLFCDTLGKSGPLSGKLIRCTRYTTAIRDQSTKHAHHEEKTNSIFGRLFCKNIKIHLD